MRFQPSHFLKFLEATDNKTEDVQLQADIKKREVFTSTKILEVKSIETIWLSNKASITQHFFRVCQMTGV